MRLNQLIERLRTLSDTTGDIDVVIRDADTDWLLEVESVEYDSATKLVQLAGDYESRYGEDDKPPAPE